MKFHESIETNSGLFSPVIDFSWWNVKNGVNDNKNDITRAGSVTVTLRIETCLNVFCENKFRCWVCVIFLHGPGLCQVLIFADDVVLFIGLYVLAVTPSSRWEDLQQSVKRLARESALFKSWGHGPQPGKRGEPTPSLGVRDGQVDGVASVDTESGHRSDEMRC